MVASYRIEFRVELARSSWRIVSKVNATGGTGNQHWAMDKLSFGLTAVLSIESFNSARSVDQFLLAGKERMAARTYFKPDLGLG
jgi:hypothetical protein